MAVRGYLGIHAEMPPTQRLRSASGKGAGRSKAEAKQQQKQKQKQSRSRSNSRGNGKINSFANKLAPPQWIGVTFAFHHLTGRALARLQLLILMHRPLERPSGGSA
jgi:hypothetical protein